jgi:uncharacterized membrane protein
VYAAMLAYLSLYSIYRSKAGSIINIHALCVCDVFAIFVFALTLKRAKSKQSRVCFNMDEKELGAQHAGVRGRGRTLL